MTSKSDILQEPHNNQELHRATDRSMVKNVLDEISELSMFLTFFSLLDDPLRYRAGIIKSEFKP
jgi:hypothetical protein